MYGGAFNEATNHHFDFCPHCLMCRRVYEGAFRQEHHIRQVATDVPESHIVRVFMYLTVIMPRFMFALSITVAGPNQPDTSLVVGVR